MSIRDTSQPILIPPIGARAGLLVREVLPGRPVWAVVLSHRTPGPFAQVGPPTLPVARARAVFLEPLLLGTYTPGDEIILAQVGGAPSANASAAL